MITLEDCKKAFTIHQAALIISNKIAFDKAKGFSTSWDGQTYWDFAGNLGEIIESIDIDSYEFQPCFLRLKRVKTKTRKLFISTWQDKIMEAWLSACLNKLLSNWLARESYAYRIGKIGVDQCQRRAIEAMKKSRYVAKRDISSFFYTIDHQVLIDQLSGILDEQLLSLVKQRVVFEYYDDDELKVADIGLPFGSPIACVLSNINLTAIDKAIASCPIYYFRYADDFLIAGNDADEVILAAGQLSQMLGGINLRLNDRKSDNFSFDKHEHFRLVNRFKYLGLEYWNNGVVRLPVEKRRKIVNIFKRAINAIDTKLRKIESVEERLALVVGQANYAVQKRIRYAAIIDYYLKHVEDEEQLRSMDMEIARLVISAVLDKPFRKKDFKTIPYKRLRELGLISLVHRNRLHRHGHLHVPFLSLYNSVLFERYQETIERRKKRIDQVRLARKLKSDLR